MTDKPSLPATMLTGGDFDPTPDTDARPVRFIPAPDDNEDETFVPMVGYPTRSDMELVARATGGGIRSAELLPEYEPDDESMEQTVDRLTAERDRLQAELATATSCMEMTEGAIDQMQHNVDHAAQNLRDINSRIADLHANAQRVVAERDAALVVVQAAEAWLDAPAVEGDYSASYELERAVMAFRTREQLSRDVITP